MATVTKINDCLAYWDPWVRGLHAIWLHVETFVKRCLLGSPRESKMFYYSRSEQVNIDSTTNHYHD